MGVFALSSVSSPIWIQYPFESKVVCFLLLVVSSLRTWLCFHPPVNLERAKVWETKFSILTLITAGLWSLWTIVHGLLLYEDNSFLKNLIMMTGIASGAVISLGYHLTLTRAYIIVSLFPSLVTSLFFDAHGIATLPIITAIYIGFLIVQSNITHRNFWEQSYQREKAEEGHHMVEVLLQSFPGYVSCIDENLVYVWANDRLSLKFGLPKVIHQQKLGTISMDRDLPTKVREFIASSKASENFEYLMKNDLESRWLMVFLNKYQEHGQQRVLILSLDIHEQKMAEQELEKQRATAIENAKLATLGEMSAGIAHEINNPLAIIQGKANLLQMKLKKTPLDVTAVEDDLKKIVLTSDRIAKIIKGLKSFTRSGDHDPTEAVSAQKVVSDVLEFSQERLRLKNVSLNIDLDSTSEFECRPVQIEQVVLNLINNAFDAVKGTDDAWIEVKSQDFDDRVQFTVTDSGKGIPPEVAEKIMRPFFTTKEVGKGTGLGLSISMNIIENHGGKLFYNATHPNTQFVFWIPKKQSQQAA